MLLRSLLFVPANRPDRIAKAFGWGASAVIVDLEDACPEEDKPSARRALGESLRAARAGRAYVRINALGTDHAFEDLSAVIGTGIDGIMVPKVETPAQLQIADWVIAGLERRSGCPARKIDLIALIESAKGMARLDAIAAATSRLRCLALGATDLTVDLGMTPTPDEAALLPIRSALVVASRAAGLEPPLDTPWIALDDREGLQQSADRVRALGFQGKLCIHPRQVAPVNACFSPSDQEIARAERLVTAFRAAEAAGSAAIRLDGELVDYAMVRRAEWLLQTAVSGKER